LYENLKDKYNDLVIFVDQPISYFYEGKTHTCYPDVLLCRKIEKDIYSILYMFDLKTNAGWFRDKIKESGDKHSDFVNELKIAENAKGKNGQKKDDIYEFRISSQLRYDLVFLTSKNINKTTFDNGISEVNKLNHTHAWVLSDSVFNDYSSNGSIQPKEDEFDKMFEMISRAFDL
jgi:hypothetical protein